MSNFVHFSMLKSGTHLARDILTQLSGKSFVEPEIIKGKNNYEDQDKFFLPAKEEYFSWHIHPLEKTREILTQENIKTVVQVRNIFDQTLSLYHHFAQSIDVEIGRGRGVEHIFQSRPFEAGLELLIEGCHIDDFWWPGVKHQLLHMERLLSLSETSDCYVLSFEDLVRDKGQVIGELAEFLNIRMPRETLGEIVERTDFSTMKTSSSNQSHFQTGEVRKGLKEIPPHLIHKMQEIIDSETSSSFDERYSYLTNTSDLAKILTK